jgi:4-hydroxy-tetrahydrodipicolinate synthase
MTNPLKGIFPAVWTPARADGSLDEQVLESNLAFLHRSGVHGLMVLGSTAEFLRFSCDERKKILEHLVAHARGLPLLANISHIRLDRAIELGKHAKSQGAFAISALPPYFYPVEQADLAEYFIRLAEAVDLPLVLYNFPEVTGKRIEVETIRAIAERAPVMGVKQSGTEFGYHIPLLELAREKNFVVMTGFDTRLAEALQLGVAGCVSGLSNAIADLLVNLYQSWVKSGAAGIETRAMQMQQIGAILGKLTFPLNVMATIEARGLNPGSFKTPVSALTITRYRLLVSELRRFYAEAQLPVPPS